MTDSKWNLATDDIGVCHVLSAIAESSSPKSLCGHFSGEAEYTVATGLYMLARLLMYVPNGCESCRLSVIELGKPSASAIADRKE